MAIRGGENVYPSEIEEFLYRHPKIQDVQVIGVPDPRYGEELCAWVRLRDGESATPEEVRAFCQGQIAHYKGAVLCQIRRRLSDDRDRQDPEIPDAPADDR
jgi:fatty-acyl-CoA synthase